MFRDEFDDGYDTVEWAAAQPFSNGHVGLYGTSYGGEHVVAGRDRRPAGARRDRADAGADRLRRGLAVAHARRHPQVGPHAQLDARRDRRVADPPAQPARRARCSGWRRSSRCIDDPDELFTMTPLLKVGEVLQEVIGPRRRDGGERAARLLPHVSSSARCPTRGRRRRLRAHPTRGCGCPRSSPRAGTT